MVKQLTVTLTDVILDPVTYADIVTDVGGAAVLSAYSGLAPIIIVGNTDVGYIYRGFGYICDRVFSPFTGCVDGTGTAVLGDEQDLDGK